MLKIIYNDSYSQLTIVNNLNNDCFNVIDDDFNKYESLSYNPFEPTKEDLIYLFKQSLMRYFDLDNKHEHVIAKSYRQDMFNKSLTAFMEWLNQHTELWSENNEND